MNERIKELWTRAGGHYNGGNQHNWPEYTITDPKKFAELIVRECAGICDALQDIPATEPRHCAEDIRIHFGVEE